jgi:hypothetical protein
MSCGVRDGERPADRIEKLIGDVVASAKPESHPRKVGLCALCRPHVAGTAARVQKDQLVGKLEEREARLVQHGANGDPVGSEAGQARTELEGGC